MFSKLEKECKMLSLQEQEFKDFKSFRKKFKNVASVLGKRVVSLEAEMEHVRKLCKDAMVLMLGFENRRLKKVANY